VAASSPGAINLLNGLYDAKADHHRQSRSAPGADAQAPRHPS